jgi:hypothetical protein
VVAGKMRSLPQTPLDGLEGCNGVLERLRGLWARGEKRNGAK